jgi:hypothetical protein
MAGMRIECSYGHGNDYRDTEQPCFKAYYYKKASKEFCEAGSYQTHDGGHSNKGREGDFSSGYQFYNLNVAMAKGHKRTKSDP